MSTTTQKKESHSNTGDNVNETRGLTRDLELQPNTRRVLLASLGGSAIEWFDFFLYGTAAGLVFNKLFFPAADPLVSLLLAYLSFGLPFFIRPVGGIVFAHIGDRIGRKKTLILTLTLMGVGTTLIGLLPTYGMVGIVAPILLVVLRLVQGLGIGGEWGGAVLLAFEFAPHERKGFFASIPQAGPPIGMLLSNVRALKFADPCRIRTFASALRAKFTVASTTNSLHL